MPTNLSITIFVFGAILLLIAILGGDFKIFGAEVSKSVGKPIMRWISGILGLFFIILIIVPLLPSLSFLLKPNTASPTPLNVTAVSRDTTTQLTATVSPLPEPSTQPSVTPSPTYSKIVGKGGHLYQEPSRINGAVLGLIWPDDKVIRLGKDFPNTEGVWVHIRVVEASPNRGEGGVEPGTEGYARADLVSNP